MIDITPHMSASDQAKAGPLFISETALQFLYEELSRGEASDYCNINKLGPVIAKSVIDWVTSIYFRNPWFHTQPTHTMSAFTVRDKDGNVITNSIVHLLRRTAGGYAIVTSVESPIDGIYYDQRIIEEIRVEAGLV